MHNFLPSQPNLNVHNTEVQAALFDTARFWLSRGVDGFRLDAINFAMHDAGLTDNPPVEDEALPPQASFRFPEPSAQSVAARLIPFIEKLAKVVRDFGADRFTVAEVGGEQAPREMKLFTAGNDRLHTSYGFDFLSADAISPGLILNTLTHWTGEKDEGWPSWAFSNHDARAS